MKIKAFQQQWLSHKLKSNEKFVMFRHFSYVTSLDDRYDFTNGFWPVIPIWWKKSILKQNERDMESMCDVSYALISITLSS